MQEMQELKLAIHGAAGRMGQRLIALGSQDERFQLVAAIESKNHPRLGTDAGSLAGIGDLGVPVAAGWEAADVVIDFSVPEACAAIIEQCRQRRTPLVVATTGLNDSQQQQIREAAETIAVVWAPSMSLAVNLVMKLSQIAASALKDYPGGADVEIIERHHRFKEDAPSGTALRFGELIAGEMNQIRHVHGRQGRTGARSREEIGYHALRVGDNAGEHTIVFGLLGETVELRVAASNRDSYALGALAAAKFAATRPAGLYNMNDVLGL